MIIDIWYLVDLAAVGEDALLVPDLISAMGESDVGSQSTLFEQFSANVARHHHLRVDLHVTIERPLAWISWKVLFKRLSKTASTSLRSSSPRISSLILVMLPRLA